MVLRSAIFSPRRRRGYLMPRPHMKKTICSAMFSVFYGNRVSAGAHPMAKRGSQSFEVREHFVRARGPRLHYNINPITATKGDDGGHTLSASSASDLALAAAPLIELRDRESNPRPFD